MTRSNWEVYAIKRNINGKEAAEKYRHDVRAKHRKYKVEEPVNHWKVVFSDYDSFTEKRFFNYFFNDDEWNEFINDTEINICSPYDCTGKLFTVRLERYETKSGTWVYHTKALDI